MKFFRYVFLFIILLPLSSVFLFSSSFGNGSKNTIELTRNNLISLRGPVESTNASLIIEKIFSSDEPEMIFYIDSPGGSVDDGLKIIEAMKGSGKKFVCIANFAASMAFSIFQQCDVRNVLDSSILMQHIGSFEVKGQANHVNSLVTLVNDSFQYLNKIDSERIGITVEELQKKIQNDWWILGSHNLKEKTADSIVQVRCSSDLSRGRIIEDIDVPMFGIKLKVEYSECPIVTDPLKIEVTPTKIKDPVKAENVKEYLKFFYKAYFKDAIKKINIK